ncbi:hypothetical protein E4U53_007021 [Claviceps sorghi]|nr:hypothetical protein E4U53_007021 [Claviceps sorghi]
MDARTPDASRSGGSTAELGLLSAAQCCQAQTAARLPTRLLPKLLSRLKRVWQVHDHTAYPRLADNMLSRAAQRCGDGLTGRQHPCAVAVAVPQDARKTTCMHSRQQAHDGFGTDSTVSASNTAGN